MSFRVPEARPHGPSGFVRPVLALLLVMLAAVAPQRPAPARAQGTLSAIETDVDQIVRRTRPSIVTVISRTERPVTEKSSERRIRTRVGSGVAVGEYEILTTASVVLDARYVWVRTSNDLQVEAKIAGIDPVSNLALLRVSDVRLPVLGLAARGPLRENEWVMSIGTARFNRERITQTIGTIAHVHQDPRLALVALTQRAYPGFSGGAVIDTRGELLGILQGELDPDLRQALAEEEHVAGTSFMLPVQAIRPVLESLRTMGRTPHGYLGVSTKAASVASETQAGLYVPIGATVTAVIPGGPAERLGLRVGDLIVGFEGTRVEYPVQLARWVAATRPGIAVEFVWVRNENQHTGHVVLSESQDAVPEWAVFEAPAVPSGGSAGSSTADTRISDLERQIQRLNRELARLKGDSGGTR
jgi:serine protease Do